MSCIEPPLPECLAAIEAQEGGPYHVVHVKDVVPMSAAFNAMILSTDARFVVQVDGDVVLKPWAVRTLYTKLRCTPGVYMAWGQLFEDGWGLGGSVRIWRRWPLRIFRFRDRRCVDRDLHARIRWTGMRRLPVDAGEPFGIHYPRNTPFARWSKAKGDCAKWRYLRRGDLIEEHCRKCPSGKSFDAMGRFAGLSMTKEEIARSKNTMRDRCEYNHALRLGKLCE